MYVTKLSSYSCNKYPPGSNFIIKDLPSVLILIIADQN